MNEIQATQHATTDVASFATSCAASGINTKFPPHMDIVTEVLGPRCCYKKYFGQLPRLNAIGEKRSTKTSTSTSHEVSPDVENLKKHNEELSKKNKKLFNRTRRHENMLKEIMGYMSTVIPNFSMTMEESDSEDENDDDDAAVGTARVVDGDGDNDGNTHP